MISLVMSLVLLQHVGTSNIVKSGMNTKKHIESREQENIYLCIV